MKISPRSGGRRFALLGGRRRGLAAVVVGGLVAGAVIGAVSPVSARETSSPPINDVAAAAREAWKTRQPVEIQSERTESSETFVLPDGTFRLRQHASPVRVRQGGGWVAPDTTLVASDGVVTPRASVLGLRFSAGGSGPLVTVSRGGKSLAMSWPGSLPAPVISGDTATYVDVLPGVDLQLSAGVDSFSEVLVVKDATAAQQSELQQIRFDLATQGLTVRQDGEGFLTATASSGEVVLASDGARMWDAPQPVGSRSMRGSLPAVTPLPQDPEPAHVEDIPVNLDGSSLTVVPSAAMLTAPTTRYPVFIDPGFNGGTEIWTHVSKKNPTKSYWTDSATRDDMRVGQLWNGTASDDWRTLVQFDVSKLRKTQIRSAAVLVNVRHSASCTATPMQLWRTNAISKTSSVTWNSTKDKWWKVLGEVDATANKSSCPKGNDEVRYAQTLVKEAFQDAATKNYSTITFAFRAKSESDEFQWKKLLPGSTYLDVVYNNKPGKAGSLTFSPCFTSCANGTALTSTKRPTLGMKVADPDGGTLRYEYEVYKADKTTRVTTSGTTVTGVASNAARTWTLKSDLADGSYFWRGRGCDAYGCGDPSDWFGFRVDTINAGTPSLTSTDYPATAWSGGPGIGGRFTFAPGTLTGGVEKYYYSLNGAKTVEVVPTAANDVVERDIVPDRDFENHLSVTAVDAAGNMSSTVDYRFRVRPIGSTWYWSMDEASGPTAASAPENSWSATASGSGVTWTRPGRGGVAALGLAGTGELVTAGPVLDTTAAPGFTVAAWVRLPAPVVADEPGPVSDPDAGDDPESEQTPPGDEQTQPPSPLPDHNVTAVSQDGHNVSMYRLGYRADSDLTADGVADPAWCFTIAAADVTGAPALNACTTSYVSAGDWVHLVGIVDRAAGRIQLYVNGLPTVDGVLVEVPGTAAWQAGGGVAIGRGWNGAASERWVGEIDEVYVASRIWSAQEIYQKSNVDESAAQ